MFRGSGRGDACASAPASEDGAQAAPGQVGGTQRVMTSQPEEAQQRLPAAGPDAPAIQVGRDYLSQHLIRLQHPVWRQSAIAVRNPAGSRLAHQSVCDKRVAAHEDQ